MYHFFTIIFQSVLYISQHHYCTIWNNKLSVINGKMLRLLAQDFIDSWLGFTTSSNLPGETLRLPMLILWSCRFLSPLPCLCSLLWGSPKRDQQNKMTRLLHHSSRLVKRSCSIKRFISKRQITFLQFAQTSSLKGSSSFSAMASQDSVTRLVDYR